MTSCSSLTLCSLYLSFSTYSRIVHMVFSVFWNYNLPSGTGPGTLHPRRPVAWKKFLGTVSFHVGLDKWWDQRWHSHTASTLIPMDSREVTRLPPLASVMTDSEIINMSFLPSGNIFRELQVVHDTGYFSAQPSLEDRWQQVGGIVIIYIYLCEPDSIGLHKPKLSSGSAASASAYRLHDKVKWRCALLLGILLVLHYSYSGRGPT